MHPEFTPEDLAQIADRAYARFMARGGEHGHDVEDWLAAAHEVAHAPCEVVLVATGPNPIELARTLRDLLEVSLADLNLAMSAPPRPLARVPRAEAYAVQAAVEPLGARVEVREPPRPP